MRTFTKTELCIHELQGEKFIVRLRFTINHYDIKCNRALFKSYVLLLKMHLIIGLESWSVKVFSWLFINKFNVYARNGPLFRRSIVTEIYYSFIITRKIAPYSSIRKYGREYKWFHPQQQLRLVRLRLFKSLLTQPNFDSCVIQEIDAWIFSPEALRIRYSVMQFQQRIIVDANVQSVIFSTSLNFRDRILFI